MAEKDFSQSELARRVGISATAIWKLLHEPAQGSKHTHRIAEVLGTSPQYLMDETEDREPLGKVSDSRLPFRHAAPERDPDLVEVDSIDLELGLGGVYLDNHVEVVKRTFSRTWLRDIGVMTAPAKLAWAKGDGDSMEPTIRDGEVVLIDRSKVTPGMDDKIWAITVGEVGMIKRLRVLPGGTVEIHSDNPSVRPATAHDGELHVLGRVVAVVRKL